MAGARQTSGQEAMVSILRKLETMVDMTNQTYEETLLILSSTESVMKNDISVELKKQSAILSSLESSSNGKLEKLITFSNLSYDRQLSILSSSESMKAELLAQLERQTLALNSALTLDASFTEKLEKLITVSNLSYDRQLSILSSSENLRTELIAQLENQSSAINSGSALNVSFLEKLEKLITISNLSYEKQLSILSSSESMRAELSAQLENQLQGNKTLELQGISSLNKLERLIVSAGLSYDRQLSILSSSENLRAELIAQLERQTSALNSSLNLDNSFTEKLERLITISNSSYEKQLSFIDSNESMKTELSAQLERQTLALNSIASLESSSLDKLEKLIELSNSSTNGIKSLESSILNSSDISKSTIAEELKKQTGAILSIETKIGQSIAEQQKTKGQEFDDKEIMTMSKSLGELAKASKNVNEKLGDNVKVFLMKVSEGFKSFTEATDPKSVKDFAESISKISTSVVLYSLSLIVATPLLAAAMPGAILFGLTLRLINKGAGEVNAESFKSMSNSIDLAKGSILFGLAMVAYSIIAPAAIIGSTLFGYSIRSLMNAIGEVDASQTESITKLVQIGEKSILFGLAMAAYAVIGIPAVIGSTLFGLSVRSLMKSAGEIDASQTESMDKLMEIGKKSLLFGLSMAAYAVIGIPAIIGSTLFGLSVRLLMKSTGEIDASQTESMDKLMEIGKRSLLFGLSMAAYAVIGIPAVIGSTLFGLSVKLLTKTIGEIDTTQSEKIHSIIEIGKKSLLFGLSMSAYAVVGIPAIIGATLLGLSTKILTKSVSEIDVSNVKLIDSSIELGERSLEFGKKMASYSKIGDAAIKGTALFGDTVKSFMKSIEDVDTSKIDSIDKLIEIGKRSLLFGLSMSAFTIVGIPAIIGSTLFGLSIRLLMKATGEIDTTQVDKIDTIMEIGKRSLLFGLSMAVYSIIGIPAVIGSTLFGLSVRLLMKSTGEIDTSQVDKMDAIMEIGKRSLLFGISMAAYSIIGIPAVIGSTLFGLSVRSLMKSTGEIDTSQVDKMDAIMEIGKRSLLFGLSMAAYSIIGIPAVIGSTLFGLSVRLLMKSTGEIDTSKVESMNTVMEIGKKSLMFGLYMAAYSIIGIPAVIGSTLFGLSVRLLMKSTGEIDASQTESMDKLMEIGKRSLLFGLSMAIYSVIGIPAVIGATLFGLSVKTLMKATGEIDSSQVEPISNLIEIGKKSLLFGLSMAVYSVIGIPAVIGSALFGLSVKTLMKATGEIDASQTESMDKLMEIGKKSLLFGLSMAVYSVIGIPAIIGSTLFGLSVKLLMKTTGEIDTTQSDNMNTVMEIGKKSLLFGLSMSAYAVIGIPAVIGATLFGLSVRTLSKVIGEIDPSQIDSINTISTIGKGSITFGLLMSLYAVIGIPAVIGSSLLGKSINGLMSAIGEVDSSKTESIKTAISLGKDAGEFGKSMASYSKIGEAAIKGVDLFGNTVKSFMKTVDEIDLSKAEAVKNLIQVGKDSLLFGINLALYSIIGIPAVIGSTLFGLTVRLLMKATGEIDPSRAESMNTVMEVGKKSLLFGLSMAVYSIIGIPAVIGAGLFGLTVRLLMKATGEINTSQIDSMNTVMEVGKKSLLFGLSMALYSIIGIPAVIGAGLFGLSVRLLMKATGEINTSQIDSMNTVMEIGKRSLLFGLSMALYSIIGIPAIIGAGLLGLTVRLLMKATGEINTSQVDSMNTVMEIGKKSLLFGLSMAIYSVIGIPAIIGAGLLGLTIRLLMKSVGEVDPAKIDSIKVATSIGMQSLMFGLSMAIYSVIGIPAIIGAGLLGLSIRLLMKSAGQVDPTQVESMNLAITIGKQSIMFGLALTIYLALAPTAMVGAILFGLTTKLLVNSAGTVDPQKVESMKSVLALAKGAILFGLSMTLYLVLAPTAMIGSVLFGLTVRMLLSVIGTGKGSKEKMEMMNGVLSLAKGVILFGLAMTIYTVVAPIAMIGAVLFGLTVRLLLAVMGTADNKKIKAMNSVLNLAKGILLFALAMVVVTALFPVVLIGAGMFALSMFIIDFGLRTISDKKSRKGILNLLFLSIGIIIFGLTLLAFTKSVTPMDVLFVGLTVATFGLIFFVMGKEFTNILKGAFAVAAIGLGVALLGLGLLIYKQVNLSWEAAAMLGVIITGLGLAMYVAGKFSTEILKGAGAMAAASAAIIVLSIGLLIYSKANLSMESVAILGAVIAGLGIAMAIAGTGPVPGFIMAGSAAMIVASAAVIVLATGLLIYKQSGFQMQDALTLGATVGILGTEMGLFGLASPFIIAGSAAMMVAGIALLPLTLGLAAFKASGFTKDDGTNLTAALGSVVNGFLGGEMPGGLIASLKFAAAAAARSALLLITVPPMILAGAALMLIVPALSEFKKAGFTQSDADSIEYMLGSVVRAFGIVTDTDRQKAMGFNVNPSDLFFGIMSLSGAGRVLSGLAQGVQSWANLEVTEWEVINPGTKDAKLVIKGKRKLNKTDFENAAFGIASVINAISEPFAKVGRLEKGQPSGDPIFDAIFGGGFVSAGIDALSRSGDTLVNLAKGVQAWANLEITEYEVVGAGTKNAKIVPKSVRKMNTMDFAMASTNIGMVIGFLANEFAKIGRMEMNTEGIFSGGVVKKGIESIAGLGDNLLSIAEVITKMANMEIVENEVKIIDGKAQLVPKSVKKITPAEMAMAAKSIGEITGFLAKEIAKIGEMESNSEGFFADGYVSKGKEAIAGLGQNLSSMADTIIKMANSEITEYKVNEKGELVPVSTRKMGDSDFTKASENIGKILGIVVDKMAEVGKKVEENESVVNKAIGALPNMTQVLADAAKPIEVWSKLKDTDKIGNSMVNFLETIKMVFDPEKSKTISDTDKYFTSFTSNIEKIASPENTLDKVATNVDRIQKSMKLLKETINQMDLKKLTLTDSLMKSIALLSKNPEAIASAIEGSIEKSFEDLVTALKEIINEANSQAQAQAQAAAAAAASAASAAPASGGTTPATSAPASSGGAGGMNTSQLAAALAAITMNVKVVNTSAIKTTG
jgi:hypothetical protein